MPANCVSLIVTDPPHSDRVPYLELSEFWNSLLGYDVSFGEPPMLPNDSSSFASGKPCPSSAMTIRVRPPRLFSVRLTLTFVASASSEFQINSSRATIGVRNFVSPMM